MRIAVVSDIHGNRDALEAADREIGRLAPDRVYHLGDLAGYNAEPGRCVRWARERTAGGVLGNHDAVAAGLSDGAGFNPAALEAALWSRGRLSADERAYLAALPARLLLPGAGILLVHGAPSDPDAYVFTADEAACEIDALGGDGPAIVLVGHTHVAAAFVSRGGAPFAREAPDALRLGPGDRAVLNPGSVGQPRDRDPRASFLLLDTREGTASWRRVAYDAPAAARKVRDAGLSPFLAERLLHGR